MKKMKFVFFSFLFVFLLFSETKSYAEIPSILRRSSKSSEFLFGLGPSVGIVNTVNASFKLSQSFIWHTNGRGNGFFIGGKLQESFITNFFALEGFLALGFDVAPKKGLAVFLSPGLDIGFSIGTGGGNFLAGLAIHPNVQIKLVLDNSWVVSIQPVGLMMGLTGIGNQFLFTFRYDILFQVGYRF